MQDNFDSFGSSFQTKLISSLFVSPGFLEQIADILKPEYFQNESFNWIVSTILKYYSEYKKKPTIDVLKIKLNDVNDDILREEIKSYLVQIYNNFKSDDLEIIQKEAIRFCKHNNMKNTIFQSIDLLKSERWDEIFHIVKKALEAGHDKNLGYEYKKDVESRYNESQRNVVETQWQPINDLVSGGFGRGELVVFVGGSGAGKSWVLANIGFNALKQGLNVIHYTLELDQFYTSIRYDSILTGIPMQNLREDYSKVRTMVDKLPGDLKVKYYPSKSASVMSLRSHIEKCILHGVPPDMIIVDYADLLRHDKYQDKRHQLEAIYQELRGLAGEYSVPLVTASQSNRSGYSEEIIRGQHISEAFEKIMISDFVASISRTDIDKQKGTGRFHIIKNRMGADGMTLIADMDLSVGKINIHSMADSEIKKAMADNPEKSQTDLLRERLKPTYSNMQGKNLG